MQFETFFFKLCSCFYNFMQSCIMNILFWTIHFNYNFQFIYKKLFALYIKLDIILFNHRHKKFLCEIVALCFFIQHLFLYLYNRIKINYHGIQFYLETFWLMFVNFCLNLILGMLLTQNNWRNWWKIFNEMMLSEISIEIDHNFRKNQVFSLNIYCTHIT